MGGGSSKKKQPARRRGPEKELSVGDLDLHIRPNTSEHRTDEYECTRDRKGDGNQCKRNPAELVIRRGAFFYLSMGLDSPWESGKHSVTLTFSYGTKPHASIGTLIEVKVDDTGKQQRFAPTEWGAYIDSKKGKSVTLKVHVPSNCIVGAWSLEVTSYSKVWDTQQLLRSNYLHYQEIIILFNPWCKDDLCYMPRTKDLDLDEYVLNETGIMYQGNPSHIDDKPWHYGQFREGILGAALSLMTLGLKPAEYQLLADPVKAVRRVGLMIKSGILLRGRWLSGSRGRDHYKDGKSPSSWQGSVKIILEYMRTHKPVKYGQCWVFSGVTTTVFRALGIPCRSVTNFMSGVETEGNNTVDKVYDVNGWNVTSKYTEDFVWNYHVWNEVWLSRRDLDTPDMDGWQALETTGYPPHEHDKQDVFSGDHLCGPCPVLALKHGYCNLNYDAGFLFSSANADEVHWEVGADGQMSVLRIKERNIGQRLSTKRPGSNKRLSLTDNYKFTEGGPEEREAVLMAHETARNRTLRWADVYDESKYKKDVKLKLRPNYGAMIGADLTISLTACNISQEGKMISTTFVSVHPKTYNGVIGKAFFREEIKDTQLDVGDETDFNFTLTEADYVPHLLENANLLIEVYALVSSQTGDQEDDQQGAQQQRVIKSRDFTFTMPTLDVQGQTAANVDNDVGYEISFTNPLSIPLTECVVMGESPGFRDVEDYCMPDIPAGKTVKHRMTFVAKRPGKHSVLFKLDTKELDVNGETTVDVAA